MDEILQKKKLVDKYLNKKKYLCLVDILFYNVDNISVYLRLDYINKNATYRVHWVNLSSMEDKNVEYWLNTNLIYPSMVDKIKNIIAGNGIVDEYKDKDKIDSKIIINSYLKDYECNKKTFEFNRYIPKQWSFLADLFSVIFEGMPRYMYPLFQISIEKLIEPDTNCVFTFDIKKDNIDSLFNEDTIKLGKKYYKEDRVIFLEKKDEFYYGVVAGKQNYLVTIINKEDTKEVQMSCNCSHNTFCKHIYALLMSIKNNEEHKFYKIAYIDDDKNILDNLKTFNYLLCVGIVDDYFVVVDNFNFDFIPILSNNKLLFKIVEDDEKKTLEKKLNKYLKKHLK